MSSTTMSPRTATDSAEPGSRRSTPPSSPLEGSRDHETKNVKTEGVQEENKAEVDEDDEEDMDHKSKALTNLLKTSSVFVAIMADKMKEQQKRNQEEAKRAAAKKQTAEAKTAESKGPVRKSARTKNEDEHQGEKKLEEEKQEEKKQDGKKLPTRSRGRPAKETKTKQSIMDYMKKEDMNLDEGPTVQEALAEAADEYEGDKIGSQDLVATEQPRLVTGGQMKQYQLEGLEWLKSLWMNGLCGILADEMGLGKTIQAISMIAFFKDNNISGPFLIAAPLSTVRNWVDEFAFWTPEINTILYHGSKEEREQLRRKGMKMQEQSKFEFPVVVTSYEICMNDKKFLGNYQWRYIIVDEGHRLKNMNCKLIKELMTYNSANRLLLTGTPFRTTSQSYGRYSTSFSLKCSTI